MGTTAGLDSNIGPDKGDDRKKKQPRAPLTVKEIQALKPGETTRKVSDPGAKGLYVWIHPSGNKEFFLRYTLRGKRKSMRLGSYGKGGLTLSEARTKARRKNTLVDDGIDPRLDIEDESSETVVETLEDAVELHLGERNLKPKSRKDLREALKEVQEWMQAPLSAITSDMVMSRHKDIGARSESSANRTMRWLRAVINTAIDHFEEREGDSSPIVRNPVDRLTRRKIWYKKKRRKTKIPTTRMNEWFQAVVHLGDIPDRGKGEGKEKPRLRMGHVIRDYFLFVILTGLRKNEALDLTWDRVDMPCQQFTIIDTKTGEELVLPLSSFLLKNLGQRRKNAKGDFVFSDHRGVHLTDVRTAIKRVREKTGVKFCMHDLRRTFASVAESLDLSGYALKALLNHSVKQDVTAGYIVMDADRLRQPMQKVTDYMVAAGGLEPYANGGAPWPGAALVPGSLEVDIPDDLLERVSSEGG